MACIVHLAAVYLLEASAYGTHLQTKGGQWMERMYGTSRPDIWEVFEGHAEVSYQAWRQGWLSVQPVDLLYGANLSSYHQREEILEMQKTLRPRLVIMEFGR